MERQNKFDEAIKASIGAIEADPSSKVWAGIRTNAGIGPVQGPQWGLKFAAAAAVLFMVGVGYFMNQGEVVSAAENFSSKVKQPRIFVAPIDYNGKAGIFLANDDASNRQYRPEADVISWGKFNKNSSNGIAENAHKLPEENQESPFKNQIQESPKLITQEQDRQPNRVPRNSPDNRVPEKSNWQDDLAPANAFASAGTKRTYHVPNPSDVTLTDIKKKSGAILGAVTAKASDFLGIDASYVENNENDRKMSTFSADFGLFKIKKVKTSR